MKDIRAWSLYHWKSLPNFWKACLPASEVQTEGIALDRTDLYDSVACAFSLCKESWSMLIQHQKNLCLWFGQLFCLADMCQDFPSNCICLPVSQNIRKVLTAEDSVLYLPQYGGPQCPSPLFFPTPHFWLWGVKGVFHFWLHRLLFLLRFNVSALLMGWGQSLQLFVF